MNIINNYLISRRRKLRQDVNNEMASSELNQVKPKYILFFTFMTLE
jgi:hypothetical protein